jgi:hypothetical protein
VYTCEDIWEFDTETYDKYIDEWPETTDEHMHYPQFNLLLVCRQIWAELEPLVYATNLFNVCRGNPLGFRRLHRMSDRALASLTRLILRLDVPHGRAYDPGWEHEDRLPFPIDVTHVSECLVVRQWEALLARLRQVLKPGTLELFIICRCMNTKSLAKVLEPLRDLPWLKECGVWLEETTIRSDHYTAEEVCGCPFGSMS